MKTTTRTATNPDTNEQYTLTYPDLEEIRKVLLELTYPEDGMTILHATENLIAFFSLDERQRNAKIRSSGDFKDLFYHMVGEAFRTLKKKGKIVQPGGRGKPYFLAKDNLPPIDDPPDKEHTDNGTSPEVDDPLDIEPIYQKIAEKLAIDLLAEIKKKKPVFFEKLVVDLLVKMGYGGSREDAGKAVGGSNDEGIDGIINEDRLGLDVVYIQAKQWEASVSRPEI